MRAASTLSSLSLDIGGELPRCEECGSAKNADLVGDLRDLSWTASKNEVTA